MGKYITTIKDLVSETQSNFSIIKTTADRGNAESCFKMGMIDLIGINSPVWFDKARQYFKNQSLSDDQDAIRILGFIEECECNYSKAFHYYAQNEDDEKDSYIDKVIKGRHLLQNYFKTLNLPISLNEEISSILKDYSKGKSFKTGASVKIAAICNDELTCIEAAKCLFEAQDYSSAIDWLKRGKVDPDNTLYITINNKLRETTLNQLNSKDLQVINLESNSLLSKEDSTSFLTKIKKNCDAASMKCSINWKDKVKPYIDQLIKDLNDQAFLASLVEEEEKKRRSEPFIIGIFSLFIGLLIVLFVLYINKKTIVKENEETNTVTNEIIEEPKSSEIIEESESSESIEELVDSVAADSVA